MTPIYELRKLGYVDIADSLADPSPQEWREIAREMEGWKKAATLGFKDVLLPGYDQLLNLVRSALRHWPRELPRDPLKHWTNEEHSELLKLCRRVPEVDTYNYYLAKIHAAPDLRLSNGQPAVRLQRFFSGAAKVAKESESWIRIGQAGQADLVGITTIEQGAFRLGIYTELEIKMPKGYQSEEQKVREQVVRSKGGIYLVAKSVKAAVAGLVEERARLAALLSAESG